MTSDIVRADDVARHRLPAAEAVAPHDFGGALARVGAALGARGADADVRAAVVVHRPLRQQLLLLNRLRLFR